MMTEQWLQSGTLRVVRRDPFETRTAKVLPLHVLRDGATAVSGKSRGNGVTA
jgi:hypothetical protein